MGEPTPHSCRAAAQPSAVRAAEASFALALTGIALLALALRCAVVLWLPTQPVSDFWSYIRLAENVQRERSYAWAVGHPTAYLAPGYPLLLAVLFAVTGPSLAATKAVGVVLSTATVVVGGLAARALLGAGAGLAAAALLCLDPRQLLLACLTASEHLGGPAMLAFLALLGLSWRSPRALGAAACAGVLLAVSALARPVGIAAWLLWPLCGALLRKPARSVAAETLVLVATLYALLLPWGFRNWRVLDRFTLSTTTAGVNLFMGNNDAATGDWLDWRALLDRVRPDTIGAGEGAVDAAAREEARRWIGAHPWRALRLYADKLRAYFVGPWPSSVAHWAVYATGVSPPVPPADVLPGPHVLKEHPRAVVALLFVRFYGLLLLAVVGGARLVRLARRSRDARWKASAASLLGLALYFPVVTAPFVVVDRYRWPMEDVLALLAGFGLLGLAGHGPAAQEPAA